MSSGIMKREAGLAGQT